MSHEALVRNRARCVSKVLKRLEPEARIQLRDIDAVQDRDRQTDAIWDWLAQWVPEAPEEPEKCLWWWEWARLAAAAIAANERVSNRRLTALVGLAQAVRGAKRTRVTLRRQHAPVIGRPEKAIDANAKKLATADYVRLIRVLRDAQDASPGSYTFRLKVKEVLTTELPNLSETARNKLLSDIGVPSVLSDIGVPSGKLSVAAAKIAGLKHNIAARRLLQGRTKNIAPRRRAPKHLSYVDKLEEHEHAAEARRRGKPRRRGHGPDA
jgi:hypothetical protein